MRFLAVILLSVGTAWLCAENPPGDATLREVVVRVTDHGQPVKEAKVYFQKRLEFVGGDEKEKKPVFVSTDAQGEARAKLLGSEVLVLIVARDFAPLQKVIPVTSPAAPTEIGLDRGLVRKLKVMGTNGLPIADRTVFFMSTAPVYFFPLLKAEEMPSIGTTDAQGFLTWNHAPRTDVTLNIPNFADSFAWVGWDCLREKEKVVTIRTE